MPPAILRVKLGRPYEMPAKRLASLMDQSRLDCCRARNAAITHWLEWRRQNPTWEPGGAYNPPARKIKRAEKPTDSTKAPPKDPPHAPREFLSRELYGVASATAPKLSTSIASSCTQEVNARLRANVPYNHVGSARFAWQAILSSEISLPTWRAGHIPMPRSVTKLHYDDSECWIRFPLLSKQSGYRVLSPKVRLHAADLTRGNRRLLRKLAEGTMRLADSRLVEVKGKWYADLCYEVPPGVPAGATERPLTLLPGKPDSDYPFRLIWTDDEGNQRDWTAGKAKPLIADYRRVEARRRALRFRYRDGAGSGHGKKRWYRCVKPLERAVRDMCGNWQKQFISDVIKIALREGCGTLIYREPTMPLRDREFFARNGVPFDWTQFLGRLKFKTECKGIAFETSRIGMAEWRGEPVAEEATA